MKTYLLNKNDELEIILCDVVSTEEFLTPHETKHIIYHFKSGNKIIIPNIYKTDQVLQEMDNRFNKSLEYLKKRTKGISMNPKLKDNE